MQHVAYQRSSSLDIWAHTWLAEPPVLNTIVSYAELRYLKISDRRLFGVFDRVSEALNPRIADPCAGHLE